jgi:peptidyl-prolyl cis-trans isomerase C
MRALTLTTALTAALFSTAVLAQAPKPAAAPGGAQPNPIIATVNNDPIRLSDISSWVEAHVPAEQRAQVGQEKLFAAAMDALVSGKALQVMARKQGLDRDPAVARQMQAAADEVLQRALLIKTVLPMVSEETIKAEYDKDFASKPGEPEVHARHILVDSEAKAKDIIKQLQAGAKFEDLVKKYSDPKDPASAQGGDLGTFKKADMLPEFSDAAFKLKKGEYTTTPVHTHYGWHVIQVLDTSISQPPKYDAVHDDIRQRLLRQDAQNLAAQARANVKIVQYGPDGKPLKPQVAPAAASSAKPAASTPAKK